MNKPRRQYRDASRDQLSDFLYNLVYPAFGADMRSNVETLIVVKIKENWQHYVTDPTPRWVSIVKPKPGFKRYG